MPNIYTFVDYTGFLSEVFESDLNFAGTWRSSANYYRYDVVQYGYSRYICTVANSNNPPPDDLQFNSYWSIIVFTSTGTSSAYVPIGLVDPEGVVEGSPGQTYFNSSSDKLWIKKEGTGTAGWFLLL